MVERITIKAIKSGYKSCFEEHHLACYTHKSLVQNYTFHNNNNPLFYLFDPTTHNITFIYLKSTLNGKPRDDIKIQDTKVMKTHIPQLRASFFPTTHDA